MMIYIGNPVILIWGVGGMNTDTNGTLDLKQRHVIVVFFSFFIFREK